MLILELVQGSQTIRCLGLRAVKMQSGFIGKPKLCIHEVVIQSYEGRLENRLDSRGMSLKPRQRFKHSVNASGSQGSLIREVPTCLWLARGKPTLEPPTCITFGNRVAKSGMPFQTQLQAILGLRVLQLAIVKYQENEISFVRSLIILF